ASAVGLYPFTDVFRSSDRISLLIATLSAGIVPVADRVEHIDGRALLFSLRPAGVIVKPDVSATPTHGSLLNDARPAGEPLVSATHTDHGGLRALYVFAHPRTKDRSATFTPAALGLGGTVYIHDWFSGKGRIASATTPYTQQISGDPAYLIVVPVADSGI